MLGKPWETQSPHLPPGAQAMHKWKMPHGMKNRELLIDSLPLVVINRLKTRVAAVLLRNQIANDVASKVISALIDAVSSAFVGRDLALVAAGAGRPMRASSNVLSIEVADLLKQAGIRGNWRMSGDEEWDGPIGIVAELEAIAQTALTDASGGNSGVMARPARITEAGRRLGKLFRE
jgi:hypothetical protein